MVLSIMLIISKLNNKYENITQNIAQRDKDMKSMKESQEEWGRGWEVLTYIELRAEGEDGDKGGGHIQWDKNGEFFQTW